MAMDNLKKLGAQRIKQAREHVGFTQEQLAEALGWQRGRLGNYEAGSRRIRPEEAHELARVLNVRASWLLCVDDEDGLTPDERTILGKYRANDRRGKDMLQRIAELEPPQEVWLKNGTNP